MKLTLTLALCPACKSHGQTVVQSERIPLPEIATRVTVIGALPGLDKVAA